MSLTRLLFILYTGLFFLFSQTVTAQDQNWNSSNGVLFVTDWPESIGIQRTLDSLRVHSTVLPSIDTLTLGYGYNTIEGEPVMSFALDWKQGKTLLFDGETIDWKDLEGDLLIESLEVRVDVLSRDTLATRVDFVVDSLMLEPYPGLFSEVVRNLTWSTIFPDLPDSTSRVLFEDGFELANPQITRITFAYFDQDGPVDMPPIGQRRPTRRTVYGPGLDIYVNFPVHINRPRPRPSGDDPTRTREPRGERIGRGDTTDDDRPRTSEDDRRQTGSSTGNRTDNRDNDDRTASDEESGKDIFGSSGKKKKKKKDDDDDDDEDLLVAAIAGVAAIALVGAAGGTVGYYGNTQYAPIGLTSGYVQPDWGILLQFGINSAVIERSETEEEHFLGKITGFYNLFDSPIQPSISLGVLATEFNGSFEYDFSASIGVAGNLGPLLLLGGYDIAAGGVDIGIAYNFKAKK